MESGEEGSGLHVGIKDLRDGLSRYLDRVKDGGTITVTEHGRPIARIRPVGRLSTYEQMRLDGRITPGKVPKGTTPLPEPAGDPDGGSLMGFVDEQRR
jgi:prevent-host-death family protein